MWGLQMTARCREGGRVRSRRLAVVLTHLGRIHGGSTDLWSSCILFPSRRKLAEKKCEGLKSINELNLSPRSNKHTVSSSKLVTILPLLLQHHSIFLSFLLFHIVGFLITLLENVKVFYRLEIRPK